MSKKNKILLGLVGSFSLLLVPSTVNAAGSTLLPPFLSGLLGWTVGANTGATVSTIITSILTILFIVVFIIAIVYTFLAAIKYIRSEGNEQKVEEAKNAVKAVLFGVGAMFVAILGIVIISALFGAGDQTGSLGAQIQTLIHFIQTGQ